MKKIKIGVSGLLSRLCAIGMTILGFSCSHSSGSEPDDILLMYGSPTGSWEIDGNVTETTGKPVVKAEIRVSHPDIPSSESRLSTETNENGNYEFKEGGIFEKLKVVCLPNDPALEPDSTVVELKYHKDKGDKNTWSKGKAQATVDFKLKPVDKK